MLVVFSLDRITCLVWNGCWVPVKDAFQQTGGFPAARGGIVPGRDRRGGRKRQENTGRGEPSPEWASCTTTVGNLVWAMALNTSILTSGRQRDRFPPTVLECQNIMRNVTRTPPMNVFEFINTYLSRQNWLRPSDRERLWYWSLEAFPPFDVGWPCVSKNNCRDSA